MEKGISAVDGLISMVKAWKVEFEPSSSFKAKIPLSHKPMKVHICKVLPSFVYEDVTLIIYRVYWKWWREFMCTTEDMIHYIEMAKSWHNKKSIKSKTGFMPNPSR